MYYMVTYYVDRGLKTGLNSMNRKRLMSKLCYWLMLKTSDESW